MGLGRVSRKTALLSSVEPFASRLFSLLRLLDVVLGARLVTLS